MIPAIAMLTAASLAMSIGAIVLAAIERGRNAGN